MKLLALGLALAASAAGAQTNVTPQVETWLESNTEADVRLIGAATATNPAPTVKLFSGVKFTPTNAKNYTFSAPCWNKASPCPQVVGMTVQVFLKLPTGRSNVTRFTGLCGSATTCVLPAFAAIQAKPGESYAFNYSRINAAWNAAPAVISATTPPPAASTVTADGTRMPPVAEIRDASGALWTPLPAEAGGIAGQIGVARNGVRVRSAVNYVTIKGGVVFNWDPPAPAGSGSGCEQWTGSAWTLVPTCP